MLGKEKYKENFQSFSKNLDHSVSHSIILMAVVVKGYENTRLSVTGCIQLHENICNIREAYKRSATLL